VENVKIILKKYWIGAGFPKTGLAIFLESDIF
jgi:hypothetical protein